MSPPRVICYGPHDRIDQPSWTDVEIRVRSLALHPVSSVSVAIQRAEGHLTVRQSPSGSYSLVAQIEDGLAHGAIGDVRCGIEDNHAAIRFDERGLDGAIEAARTFFDTGSLDLPLRQTVLG